MQKFLVCGLTVLMIAGAGQAVAGGYTAYGSGYFSCGDWTSMNAEHEKRGTKYYDGYQWMLGFISGAGWMGYKMADSDYDAMKGFVDNYCLKNPLDIVEDAADALALELHKRYENSANTTK